MNWYRVLEITRVIYTFGLFYALFLVECMLVHYGYSAEAMAVMTGGFFGALAKTLGRVSWTTAIILAILSSLFCFFFTPRWSGSYG